MSEPYDTPQQPKEANLGVFWTMLIIALVLACALAIALAFSPSKRHKIHQSNKETTHHQEASKDIVAVSNPPIHTVGETNNEIQKGEEVADAKLTIEWIMADIAWMGMFIGVIGIGFLIWTLGETRAAGKIITQQNENARKASVAEFQPYILFEQSGEIGYKNGYFNRRDAMRYADSIQFPIAINISNIGKTPALDVFWRVHGAIRNNMFSAYPKFPSGVASIKQSSWSKKYVLENMPVKIKAVIGIQFDEDITIALLNEGDSENETVFFAQAVSLETSEIQLFCRVSFKDSFIESNEIRVVSAEYKFNEDRTGLLLHDFEEVTPDAEDYKTRNQKQPKHQPAPEA